MISLLLIATFFYLAYTFTLWCFLGILITFTMISTHAINFNQSKDEEFICALTVCQFVRRQEHPIDLEWGNETKLYVKNVLFSTDYSICRYIARIVPKSKLYGSSVMESVEVDNWLSYIAGPLSSKIYHNWRYLDSELFNVTYLVGHHVTLADIVVWCGIYRHPERVKIISKDTLYKNIYRWYALIESQQCIQEMLFLRTNMATIIIDKPVSSNLKDNKKIDKSNNKNDKSVTAWKEEGKFIELPGAEMGKVVVRFPPEASGYLHIGHAKAALLNQYYKDAFEGKLIMRFDDTNPAKEKVDFEKVILEDLKMLEIKPDLFTHTSDYFDVMLDYCEKLIKDKMAYVDDTDPVTMKAEREQKIESKHRNNDVSTNLSMWNEMKLGTPKGATCCVRAKISMTSVNGCLRDPTIYRCKNESHPRTGNKYKVYPTYDFACPIVDSLEGVTHCLRTMEYHDRDDQFYWFIDQLNLRKPYIWEYSRLNMTNTVLSKRKLTWFVEEGLVDGWDDPRLPTVRGILRRGMTVEGLKQFIISQGSSRNLASMGWDKIWAINKKVIDPIAPRYTAIDSKVLVRIDKAVLKCEKVPKHPKNTDVGEKEIWIGPRVFVDYADAVEFKEGEDVTFINWGNVRIKKINWQDGHLVDVEAEPNLSNVDYKKTMKITWLAETIDPPLIPCICVYFSHIITKPNLGKDEDFKQFIAADTKFEVQMVGDPELRNLKKSDIIQLQRKGFFICDSPYQSVSAYVGCESPVILFNIPDGHAKDLYIPKSGPSVRTLDKIGNVDENAVMDKSKLNTNQNLVVELLEKITVQGNKLRELKGQKADKAIINEEVTKLLSLKEEYKNITGQAWNPEQNPKNVKPTTNVKQDSGSQSNSGSELLEKIAVQGNKIRELKEKKAETGILSAEISQLLSLKEEYKNVTGEAWKPELNPTNLKPKKVDSGAELSEKIVVQGNKVRELKEKKSDKSIINEEVSKLLSFKEEYKNITGAVWKPEQIPTNVKPNVGNKPDIGAELMKKIADQGNKIRELKENKADKGIINEEVAKLLSLKDEYKNVTGEVWKPEQNPKNVTLKSAKDSSKNRTSNDQVPQQKKEIISSIASEPSASSGKKQTRLGLEAKKETNLPDWYSQVITKGEMIEYYDVSGCYILRPWAYSIWESIQSWFDSKIKELDVQNCYFPIFVSKSVLEKEKTHIADFAPEVAWVTKSGDTDLAEHVAIRPTSETVMYPAYAKWIQSYRDLPLKLNQWNNVVRWEFKHPQPFLRTREFLWQEGHTAYASLKDAEEEVYVILDLYAKVYTDLLAIPVVKGRKTEKEKFAGGDYTTTVEAYIAASGRAIQGATSHHLGQNFSKMFEVHYEDPEAKEKKFVYQNSWGLTTRTIGVMIMIHADNQGLVIPPRVISVQVVIIPCGIGANMKQEDREMLYDSCYCLERQLKEANIKVKGDYRENYSPGWKFNHWELKGDYGENYSPEWKFNHWELKGVPIRIELGPKDIKSNQLVAVRRDTFEKITIKLKDVVGDISNLLDKIHDSLYNRAKKDLETHTVICNDWANFSSTLDKKNLILSPFCGETPCEDRIKQDSARDEGLEPGAPSMGAKSLCIPFEQPSGGVKHNQKCIHPECSNLAKFYTLFGRSY